MNRSNTNWLIIISVLLAISLVIDLNKVLAPPNPLNLGGGPLFSRNVETKLGLDLRGGLQALLEADLPAGSTIASADLETTRQILEKRANALGVSEVVMQTAGDRRIVAEFPGVKNPEDVISSLQQTGLLEFVDTGDTRPTEGSIIQTDYATGSAPVATPTPGTDGTTAAQPETVYHTIMTGKELKTVGISTASISGKYNIDFTLSSEGAKIFGDHTTANIGKVLTITLDKRVISAPSINNAITDGRGLITGSFTSESANALAAQLKYGSLPVPIKVVKNDFVGATLGEESVRKSLMAGSIGLTVVIVFMLLYYRLPGFIATLALISYAIFSLALFRLIPIVLTLPGIAGFILSIGMAVDANILIFERLKEELRAGRNLRQAIDLGWSRAWPSIRDSNTSTLITCLILYIFGNSFGASMVKGFSITLALGVGVSLFTAIIVTRTFLHTLLDKLKSVEHPRWFGL
ncbi:MAG TPA: protein translocase subunit SecD [Anaerolineales bacterium]|nr:protein translocase subunit SecD [Anaerolineales bacterium]